MTESKPDAGRRRRVSGIERTVQILDMLTDRGSPASAYDIAKSIGAPISTVYSIVEELSIRGMLSRTIDNSVWLGPRLFRYGLAYESRMDLLTEAKHEMTRLSLSIGETVQICCRDEGMMVVVAMADGQGHFRISSDVGTRVPLNWTASGRLLLGHLPKHECREAFASASQSSPTGMAETDPEILATQAGADFRERLAVQLGASEFSVACIASPIRDRGGQCAATISIVLPELKAKNNLSRYSEAVRNSAGAIEQALGRRAA